MLKDIYITQPEGLITTLQVDESYLDYWQDFVFIQYPGGSVEFDTRTEITFSKRVAIWRVLNLNLRCPQDILIALKSIHEIATF